MSTHVTYASRDPLILEKAFQLLQGTGLRMPSIDTRLESTTSWDRFSQMIHAVGAVLCTSTYSSAHPPIPVLKQGRTLLTHIHQGITQCVNSTDLAQLMSHATLNSQSQGEHSYLINIGGSANAPGSVPARWVLLLASPSMQVSVQPHVRIRTADAPTEDNITYMHCILLTLKTHSELQIRMILCDLYTTRDVT